MRNRPLHAYVSKHNLASIRDLEKCGFVQLAVDEQEVLVVLTTDSQIGVRIQLDVAVPSRAGNELN